MLQRQREYYHCRVHFSYSPKEGGIKDAAEKLLQRCNFIPSLPVRLGSSSYPDAPHQPLRFFMIPQLMEWLNHTQLQPTTVEFIGVNEQWGNKYPYWFVKFSNPNLVATLQRYMPTDQTSMQLHYYSRQFDEFYSFCGVRPATLRSFNFWDRQSTLTEIFLRCKERKFDAIDYSTLLIPE